MRLTVCVLVLLVTGAGCIEGDPEPSPCAGDPPTSWAAYDGRWPVDRDQADGPSTDPRQPWETVVAVRGGLDVDFVGAGGSARMVGNGSERLAILSTPVPPQDFAMQWQDQDTACGRFFAYEWPLSDPVEGELVEAGGGALVHTAGFWENGTLFYTNVETLHESDWPRAGWYGFSGGDPLQVYVYDQDGSEIPPHWGGPDQGLPIGAPASGPTEYFTTIPGFNEALKGLSTTTTTVAHLTPEEAYTRPGNEEHPLYGDALVFLIQVVAVADRPCPAAAHGTASGEFCFRS